MACTDAQKNLTGGILAFPQGVSLTAKQIDSARHFCENELHSDLLDFDPAIKDLPRSVKDKAVMEMLNSCTSGDAIFQRAYTKAALRVVFSNADEMLNAGTRSKKRVAVDYEGRIVYPKSEDLHSNIEKSHFY